LKLKTPNKIKIVTIKRVQLHRQNFINCGECKTFISEHEYLEIKLENFYHVCWTPRRALNEEKTKRKKIKIRSNEH
jgi:hypothetical protein